MRYTIDEVLSGMLASIERDDFTDDSQRLGEVFKGLSQEASLFAPFAALAGEADFSAVLESALQALVSDGHLQHEPGRYHLTPAGRARCVTSKRLPSYVAAFSPQLRHAQKPTPCRREGGDAV